MPDPPLLDRWRETAGAGAAAEAAGRDLLARYAEPHRRYHTAEHLAEMLDALDVVGGGRTARLAAWFHDAVYDPRRVDNEERSARLAARVLPTLGVAPHDVADVARLVLLTRGHDPAPEDTAGAALCDADLAVLGAEPRRYAAYAAAVRAEYAAVPDRDFAAGRARVLRGLLDRERLYATAEGVLRWEGRARENLSRELAGLLG